MCPSTLKALQSNSHFKNDSRLRSAPDSSLQVPILYIGLSALKGLPSLRFSSDKLIITLLRRYDGYNEIVLRAMIVRFCQVRQQQALS